MNLSGACHCARISYQLDWPDAASGIPARRCGCSYCTRFNGTWTSHPDARLTIRGGRVALKSAYRFGTGTADFLFCEHCGVTVAALCETVDGLKAVINVNTLAGEDLLFEPGDSNFDGETAEQRLNRRNASWIADVILK